MWFLSRRIDRSGEFPEVLDTCERGSLKLVCLLFEVNGKVGSRVYSYKSADSSDEVAASFGPSPWCRPDVDAWQKTFDVHYAYGKANWRNLLLVQESLVRRRLDFWLPDEQSMDEFIRTLRLRSIHVTADAKTELTLKSRKFDFCMILDARHRIRSLDMIG